MKRLFDVLASFLVLIITLPFMVGIAILISLDSKGGVFYRQQRIGKGGVPFRLYKFRTMRSDADNKSKITIGDRDPRVTRVGFFIRKYKLDELPQLLNILKGDMSVVGPRPEVEQYVKLYTTEQRKVLSVKPGLTDYASLEYVNESELLSKSSDPHRTYVEEIMPDKLRLNLKYINNQGFLLDIKLILDTIFKIIR